MNNTFTWSPDELYHHGIKGQKWGLRRYQNPDGTLTEEGKARYLSEEGRSKSRDELSNAYWRQTNGKQGLSSKDRDKVIKSREFRKMQSRLNQKYKAYEQWEKDSDYKTIQKKATGIFASKKRQQAYDEVRKKGAQKWDDLMAEFRGESLERINMMPKRKQQIWKAVAHAIVDPVDFW